MSDALYVDFQNDIFDEKLSVFICIVFITGFNDGCLVWSCGAGIDSLSSYTTVHPTGTCRCFEFIVITISYMIVLQFIYTQVDDVGQTALHLASRQGHGECVRILLAYRSDINAGALLCP